ncbi:MAG: uracil-DNA glycosylase [Woeseiaceae bacterium]
MPAERDRLEYLGALGIDVWVPREQAAQSVPDLVEVTVTADDPVPDWTELQASVAGCTRCPLHKSRTQTVFGVGNRHADWMIIGEAPGAEEDRRGEPFVGRAGKLLDEMLRAVGLDRGTVFITNILKCRPPGNRDPAADEAAACRDYLERQIELIKPRLVLAVGRIAAQQLLHTDSPLGRLRGRAHSLTSGQVPLVVTYHPAYLLRSPSQKRKVWEDLCLARQIAQELST